MPTLPDESIASQGGMRFAFTPYGQWPPPCGHFLFIIYRLGSRPMRNYRERYIVLGSASTLPAGGIGIICPPARSRTARFAFQIIIRRRRVGRLASGDRLVVRAYPSGLYLVNRDSWAFDTRINFEKPL